MFRVSTVIQQQQQHAEPVCDVFMRLCLAVGHLSTSLHHIQSGLMLASTRAYVLSISFDY